MVTPLAHTIADVCAITHNGKTAVYGAINNGELRAVKRGRRTLVLHSDLLAWIEGLPAIEIKGRDRKAAHGAADKQHRGAK